MREDRKKLDTAMAKLFLKEPFYAGILMRLKVVPQNIGTFATDGRKLFYDPKMLDEWNANELEGVLKHEATHVMALHPLRKAARENHKLWNICCDAEVNHMLAQCSHGTTMPQGSIPGDERLAEDIYADIDENGGGKIGDGEGGWCEVRQPELAPGEDPAEVAREVEGIVREAAAQARMWGNLPAGVEQYLDELLNPSVDWETILRNFVEGFYEPFSDWASPNRRYVHKGVILPGNSRRRTFADVALAVDVSGSMLGGELQQACGEVAHIIHECYGGDCEIPVIWFDTDYNLDIISAGDEMVPKGGGGTDFDAVMRCFVEEQLPQKGLIVITDGYADMNINPQPDVPVMWAVFGEYAKQFTPPFGEVVQLELT